MLVARQIRALGYDLNDPHLLDTPTRVARFQRAWHTIGKEPPPLTTFPNDGADEMVVVDTIRFYSLCSHHGLPFLGNAHIGYVPSDRLLGLSKFARVVDYFAHRFQVQERLTKQVADYLAVALEPKGLGVVLRAEHLCMSMRGVERPGHRTTTSDLRGAMRDPAARAEFMGLVGAA